jgi:hypothetical protein
MKKIVVMPGGFHPFHAGHAALYQSAVKAFPDAEVYVAATNDTKSRPFPFSIKEKLAKLAGVAPGHFIQVKSPFKAEEITSHYNPNEDVLIFVRSEKDKTEQPKPGGMKKDGTPAYFQPYTGKNLQPFSQHAYMAYLPTVEFGPGITSASEIRAAWPTLNDKRKTAMVMSLYPTTQKNPKLAANVVKMLDMGMGNELNEGISLHDVAWIGNLVPSFMQRIASAGTREAKQTAILGKILGKWIGTGELTPGEEAFAKQQLIDIAKMIAGMAVASAVTASAPAHAAATAVASGVTHIAQHGAVDLGLDALAVMLSKNFKFDFLKKIMHSLETDSGKAYSHVEKKQFQAPHDDVDKQVNQQFQKAKMGFGGMSEEINEMLGFKIVKTPNKTTKQTTSLADMRKEFEKDKSTNLKKYSNNTDTKNPKYVRTVAAEENMAEAGSNTMASTAGRLTNKNDGKVAKLRAAGDRRREDQLKGRDIAKSDKTSNDEWGDVKESTSLSVEQLAQISDKALDDAYHYGRSTPGANFGWMANLQSAKAAKRLIDAGEIDIEKISDAIHKGWNVTAAADYKGQLQLDTPTPDEKKLKRAKLAMQSYAQLPEEEKEKDRVVARALLSALGGKVDEEFGTNYPGTYEQENGPFTHRGGLRTTSLTTESIDYLNEK